MSLRTIACTIVFLTGCVHTALPGGAQPVRSSARSSAANVMALVPVVVEEPAEEPAAEPAQSDLADLDIEIPTLEHDFQLEQYTPHAPHAAPAPQPRQPKAVQPTDTFPRQR